jgi:phospholipid N-methyltransferase
MQGTRLLIESLLFPLPDDNDRLVAIQKEINSEQGKNILELGAGVGVVGTILAAATKCKVLLTDL